MIKSNRWSMNDNTDGSALPFDDILGIMKANDINTGFQPLLCSGLGSKLADTSLAAFLSTEVEYRNAVIVPDDMPTQPASDPARGIQFTAAEEKRIAAHSELNSACRGGSGSEASTAEACSRRDREYDRLATSGICNGTIDDDSSAAHYWHRCNARSLARNNDLPARAASTSSIPAPYRGRWDESATACQSEFSAMRLNVSATTLKYYESIGTVTKVDSSYFGLQVTTRNEGEGDTWTDNSIMSLSDDGQFLTVDDAKRIRC